MGLFKKRQGQTRNLALGETNLNFRSLGQFLCTAGVDVALRTLLEKINLFWMHMALVVLGMKTWLTNAAVEIV